MTRKIEVLREEYARLISQLTVDEIADLWHAIDSDTLLRMVQAAEVIMRERNPDPTGFAPPRYDGDDTRWEKGE